MAKKLNLKDVTQYVEENIGDFHKRRIEKLDKLKLFDVLKRKNPYLFKAKNLSSVDEIVKEVLNARISSSEETIFGDWLDRFANFIFKKIFGEIKKSTTSGIDLEFERNGIRYIVVVKSGPNWANKDQKAEMLNIFYTAKKTFATSGHKSQIICINGCCYGKDRKPHKFPKKGTDYFKYCGQEFWEFISEDPELFLEIIEPLGHKAKEKNEEYQKLYSQRFNIFLKEFIDNFCDEFGAIDWEKLVRFNSEKK